MISYGCGLWAAARSDAASCVLPAGLSARDPAADGLGKLMWV